MKKCSVVVQRCFSFISWVGVAGAIAAVLPDRTVAQIVPDASLGAERSVVTPNTVIRGLPSDRIDGGAIRGSNLFHSFQQFSIGEGRGAYFANPAGIENILSRVTGNSRSEILGRLGVLGNANLFLINPNGIVFGPNASLDVAGSFTATTANAIALSDQGFFSATQPENSTLLAIAPGALYFDQQVRQPRTIQNSGNLTAGRNLTLAADNLELQGQVRSGGNLTLQAQDTLRIRDSVTTPFIASAGGKLLVQGDRSVDIFALNHPDSGLFSGGDMVLRSANQVGGDAHYWSSGNFRVEQLNGSLGALYSPYDPVIRALGDVRFDAYIGSSLHILAAGKVEIPDFIRVIGSDTPTNSLTESVRLSNETDVLVDGSNQPTVDIRAGVDPNVIGASATTGFGIFYNPLPSLIAPTPTTSPTSADIRTGTIFFADVNNQPLAGTVLLTNQYRPNPALSGSIQVVNTLGGDLTTIAIRTGTTNNGGFVAIDSKGQTAVRGIISTNSELGNGGNVTLLANNDVVLLGAIFADGLLGGGITLASKSNILLSGFISSTSYSLIEDTKGGDINLTAQNIFADEGLAIATNTFGRANAGNINIKAIDAIRLAGRLPSYNFNGVQSNVGRGAIANGGNINIKAGSFSMSDGIQIQSAVRGERGVEPAGQGNAGNINIDVRDNLILTRQNRIIDSTSIVTVLGNQDGNGATGRGGNITVHAGNLILNGGTGLTSSTYGKGDAGNISINVDGAASINGGQIDSAVESGAVGNGGNIRVEAGSLFLSNDSKLRAVVNSASNTAPAGRGNAGKITLQVRDGILIDGANSLVVTTVLQGAEGDGGDINVATGSLSITNGASLITGTLGFGNAGNIKIQATNNVRLSGVDRDGDSSSIASAVIDPKAVGNGGDIVIDASSISIEGGAIIASTTGGRGNAGRITLRANGSIRVDGVGSNGISSSINSGVGEEARGDGGNIEAYADSLIVASGALLNASASGQGSAGNILLNIRGLLQANNGKISTTADRSSGGAIDITARDIRLRGNSDITTFVNSGAGGGGNITLAAKSILAFNDSDILSFASDGQGGNITLNTRAFFGQNYRPAPRGINPRTLDRNNRVDVNASGTVSGTITIPDTTFIQNSLTQLAQNLIDPNTLLANSCIIRSRDRTSNGTFLVTGSGGLPVRPGDAPPASFPTGEVRSLPQTQTNQTWKPGDPIVEPQGIYRLASGKLVMSRECAP